VLTSPELTSPELLPSWLVLVPTSSVPAPSVLEPSPPVLPVSDPALPPGPVSPSLEPAVATSPLDAPPSVGSPCVVPSPSLVSARGPVDVDGVVADAVASAFGSADVLVAVELDVSPIGPASLTESEQAFDIIVAAKIHVRRARPRPHVSVRVLAQFIRGS